MRSIFAILATATLFFAGLAPGQPKTKTQGDFNLTSQFTVEIDGVVVPGIQGVEGLNALEPPPETYEHKKLPGRMKSGNITLTRGVSPSAVFFEWANTLKNAPTPKTVSITGRSNSGDLERLILYRCLPTKYQGPQSAAKSTGHATESLEIRCESVEWKKP